MAEQAPQATSPETPAAPAAAPSAAAASSAPAAEASKFAAEAEQYRKAAEKSAKQLADLQKRVESPEFTKELLSRALGLDKGTDPAEQLKAKEAALASATQAASSWQAKAKGTALRAAAAQAALKAGVSPAYVSDAVQLADLAGIDVDDDTLSVRDVAALEERFASFIKAKPIFAQQQQAQASNAPPLPAARPPVPPNPQTAVQVAPRSAADLWNAPRDVRIKAQQDALQAAGAASTPWTRN